jgi:hypothetical protein
MVRASSGGRFAVGSSTISSSGAAIASRSIAITRCRASGRSTTGACRQSSSHCWPHCSTSGTTASSCMRCVRAERPGSRYTRFSSTLATSSFEFCATSAGRCSPAQGASA